MNTDTLPPDLVRFADEAVAAGRFRDVAGVIRAGVAMQQRSEAAHTKLLASVVAAEAERMARALNRSGTTVDDLIAERRREAATDAQS